MGNADEGCGLNDATKVQEWCRFYRAAQPSYRIFALVAILKNDGEKMLAAVVKALALDVQTLVKDSAE